MNSFSDDAVPSDELDSLAIFFFFDLMNLEDSPICFYFSSVVFNLCSMLSIFDLRAWFADKMSLLPML